jgi:hypothetical protein
MTNTEAIQHGLAKSSATRRTKQIARLIETAPALREADIKRLSDLLVTHPRLPEVSK